MSSNSPSRPSLVLAAVFSLATTGTAFAASDAGVAPDNTKVNARDRGASPTADNQKNDKSDVELTRQIRRAIIKDKTLSVYAHNVKIISQSGAVTLKGPVHSDAEKATVEKAATDVAGADKVTSELEVKP